MPILKAWAIPNILEQGFIYSDTNDNPGATTPMRR
jgi:hypothetical protein